METDGARLVLEGSIHLYLLVVLANSSISVSDYLRVSLPDIFMTYVGYLLVVQMLRSLNWKHAIKTWSSRIEQSNGKLLTALRLKLALWRARKRGGTSVPNR
jgi:hypothetical protein